MKGINEIFQKHFVKRITDYILGKRYCLDCADKYIKPGTNIVQTLAICSECEKPGMCFYENT